MLQLQVHFILEILDNSKGDSTYVSVENPVILLLFILAAKLPVLLNFKVLGTSFVNLSSDTMLN